jgi:excisionase family DNA binding protein
VNRTELMTAEEVASYLRVNKYTIYRMVSDKKLPAIRIGNQLRFKRSAFERWLRKNTIIA